MAAKQKGNANAQREQVLQQLHTAFKVYSELKGNLGEGIQVFVFPFSSHTNIDYSFI